MIPDLKLYAFMSMFVWSIMVGWSCYEFGYYNARIDYSQPIKYRCHEGTVYRSTQGYWENTKQACKSLEEIK